MIAAPIVGAALFEGTQMKMTSRDKSAQVSSADMGPQAVQGKQVKQDNMKAAYNLARGALYGLSRLRKLPDACETLARLGIGYDHDAVAHVKAVGCDDIATELQAAVDILRS